MLLHLQSKLIDKKAINKDKINKTKNKKNNRKQNLTFVSPAYSENVEVNKDRYLLSKSSFFKHVPTLYKYHNLCNENNMKANCSSIINIKTTVSDRNEQIIHPVQNLDNLT